MKCTVAYKNGSSPQWVNVGAPTAKQVHDDRVQEHLNFHV